jgi:glycosyltransferase involved in cell wall biosynthesis
MIEVTVVSPVRNEQDNVVELVERVDSALSKACGKNWEFLMVNDASTDSTEAAMKALEKKYKNVRHINHSARRGQTGCFKTGFDNARGKFVVTMDADLQVHPEDLPLFIEKMRKGYELVNGIRENRQHPFWIKIASKIYNIMMTLFFDINVFDAASNYTSINAKYLKSLPLTDNDHRYLIPILQRRGLTRIGDVVVHHEMRRKGKSKYSALPKYIKGGFEIFQAWWRIKSGRYDWKK